MVVSDFFDFSIYVDAAEADIERWYQHRFLSLQQTAFRRSDSYFHHYQHLSQDEAMKVASDIWREINLRNLRENIAPTRGAPTWWRANRPTTVSARSCCG